MVDATAVRRLAEVIERERPPEAEWPPRPPDGWQHLPVALVDTVFSLQARYSAEGEVFAPVERYARWAAPRTGMDPDALLAGLQRAPASRDHTVSEMLDLLHPLSSHERVEVFGNRRPAYTQRGAPRRADVVVQAARTLAEEQIETRYDFARHYRDADTRGTLHSRWLSVPGFGKRSWEYIPMLCGLPGVKADVHVTRFVAGAVAEAKLTPEGARALVLAVTEELRRHDPGPEWTSNGVEHFIWRVASGRSLVKPPARP